MKWWSQPPVFASVRSNAVLSHRCLLPGHQPVRWRLSLLPSSSRTPGLLARRANGARDWIRLCAEMKAGTSTPGEDRGSGPITRSGICQRVDDLPQAGHSRRDQVHTDNDGEPVLAKKGQTGSPPKEAAGRPPDRGAGLGSRYGCGATIPVCGDCPAPPKKNRSPPRRLGRRATGDRAAEPRLQAVHRDRCTG